MKKIAERSFYLLNFLQPRKFAAYMKGNIKMRKMIGTGVVVTLSAFMAVPAFASGTSYTNAQKLKLNTAYHATILEDNLIKDYYPMQYFSFKTSNRKNVTYKVKMSVKKWFNQGANYQGEIRTSLKNKNYRSIDFISTGSASVKPTKPGNTYIAPTLQRNTTYYLVNDMFYDNTDSSSASYSIKVIEQILSPAKTKLISVRSGRKSLVVRYKKAKGTVYRYQIAIKTTNSGKYKIYTNGKKYSKTIKHLKSNRKYIVKIRAQRKENGKWYNAKWSAAKIVRVK